MKTRTLIHVSLLMFSAFVLQSRGQQSDSSAVIHLPPSTRSMRPQPFGLRVGMTRAEVISEIGKSAVKDTRPQAYGLSMSITTTPKPNSSFLDFSLKLSDDGLFEVRAYTPAITSADSGTQVREKFDEIKELISAKYGNPQCYDYRESGAADRPDFFMMYLKDKEQHLICYWRVGKDDIALQAVGLNIQSAILSVTYQFSPELERAKAKMD